MKSMKQVVEQQPKIVSDLEDLVEGINENFNHFASLINDMGRRIAILEDLLKHKLKRKLQ